jgi:hypothetical protein
MMVMIIKETITGTGDQTFSRADAQATPAATLTNNIAIMAGFV